MFSISSRAFRSVPKSIFSAVVIALRWTVLLGLNRFGVLAHSNIVYTNHPIVNSISCSWIASASIRQQRHYVIGSQVQRYRSDSVNLSLI
jgi:hypothetical protein